MKKILFPLLIFLLITILFASVENFLTYTEVDPDNDNITVTADRVFCDQLDTRTLDQQVYKDFTADYFNGDFIHAWTLNTTLMEATAHPVIWMVSNYVDDIKYCRDNDKDYLAVYLYNDATRINLEESTSGTEYNFPYFVFYPHTLYLTLYRDETDGTYGSLNLYIHSSMSRSTSSYLDKLEISLHAKTDFQYLFAVNTYNINDTPKDWTGYVEKLNLTSVVPSTGTPNWQDFTAWTELDPAGNIHISKKRVGLWATSTKQTDSRVTKDYGAGYWSGDFYFSFTVYSDEYTTNDLPVFWGVSNVVDDLKYMLDNNVESIHLCLSGGTIVLQEYKDGSYYSDSYAKASPFLVYCVVERDDDYGDYGLITCKIYDDADYTTRLDSLGIVLHEKVDYRYVYSWNMYNSNNAGQVWTGYIEEMEDQYYEESNAPRNIIKVN